MANYTLTDVQLFFAGAILVNFILDIYINKQRNKSGCMRLDAGDSRCHGHSLSMEKNN